MRLLFRVDASARIGNGHVMRCLALADALRVRGHESIFLSRLLPGHRCDAIRQRGFEVLELPAPGKPVNAKSGSYADWLGVDWSQDADQAAALIGQNGVRAHWLVVDHYALDYRWHARLRRSAERLMVVDDLANRRLDCDLLVVPSPGHVAGDFAALVDDPACLRLGPAFALLAPAFRARRLARRSGAGTAPGGLRLLLAMGGVDASNHTARVLQAVEQVAAIGAVDVVLGSNAPHLDAVRRQAAAIASRSRCTWIRRRWPN